ncbi:hypothetical protein TELCIR_15895 [Teladorsagia circumcincta]|uniref:Uncharacterized protein n=1 Tax=Teladorsagia circumcincta TaxID=45464 RepID=A0A2G9TX05_TELCI|nr:hypothetical protein TELCIR_15895 [Teladorsagia circumcincta]
MLEQQFKNLNVPGHMTGIKFVNQALNPFIAILSGFDHYECKRTEGSFQETKKDAVNCYWKYVRNYGYLKLSVSLTIISRNYRGDVDMGVIDRFLPLLMDREEDGLACPVFTEYFKDVEEESVRDNFVVIYELLDEMMDFGFPQTTESRILQE